MQRGYHLAKDRFEADNVSCSNRDRNKLLWKAIWNIKGPNATKIFLWKACNGILLTKEMLFKKHVTNNSLCPICNLERETTGHILWSCPSARDVWTRCSNRAHKCASDTMNFMEILEKLLDRLNKEELQCVVFVAQ